MTNSLSPIPTRELAELTPGQREFMEASHAANTKRTYDAALRDFYAFGGSLPCSVQTLLDYIELLAKKANQRPSTIQVKLAAIGLAHRSAGFDDPTHAEPVRLLMQGIRRKLGTARNQKSPLLREDLAAMVAAMPHDLRGLRNRAMLLLCFAGAFRRSELVALSVSDVKFLKTEMVVTVRQSKTDQEKRGAKKRIPLLDDATLCPVRALKTWLNEAGIREGPLFRAIDQWGHLSEKQMSDRDVAIFVKQAAARLGYDVMDFSGHSPRAGFVTQAATDRVPEADIQEVTGHKSIPVLRQYIRDAGAGQVRAIRKALGEGEDAK